MPFAAVQYLSLTQASVAYVIPMVLHVLSHGQDLDRIYVQYPGQDWLGYYGSAWLHHPFVLDVLSAKAGGN